MNPYKRAAADLKKSIKRMDTLAKNLGDLKDPEKVEAMMSGILNAKKDLNRSITLIRKATREHKQAIEAAVEAQLKAHEASKAAVEAGIQFKDIMFEDAKEDVKEDAKEEKRDKK